ncbi:ester cyclase [Methanolacinia petrolearia]|uniref:ester cyclase n=1 Tax=Methanolacinia petrolearia TaxID=54120 RepID=UPI003BA9D091
MPVSPEDNKEIVRRFIDAHNTRNLDLFSELVDPGYIDNTHKQEGIENFRKLYELAFAAFPDWHEEIVDMIAEEDKVWVCVEATGTHTGEWNCLGVVLPPTGSKVAITMVFIWRIADGRLAEGWGVDSDSDFLYSLGLMKYTEKGEEMFFGE